MRCDNGCKVCCEDSGAERTGDVGVLTILRKSKLVGLCACFIFFVIAKFAFGADEKTELAPVVVTARGYAVPEERMPFSVGVISDQTGIKLQNPVSIPDLLALIPGVSRESDSAWSSEINIRGMSRESVVFLIDGVRVNTATDINARFGMLDPGDIERIEVLKGPVSALYGSGSFGGVVNVITRGADYAETPVAGGGLALDAGSNPRGYGSRGHARWSAPDLGIYISQTYRDYDSYKDGSGDTVRNSQFRDNSSTFRLGYRPFENYEVKVNVQYYEGHEIGIPGTGVAPLPVVADVTYPVVRRGMFSLVNNYMHDLAFLETSRFIVYYQTIERRVRVDNFPEASPVQALYPRADHRTMGSQWTSVFRLDSHTIATGADVWQRRLENSKRRRIFRNGTFTDDQPLPSARFTSAGVFAEDDWQVNDFLNAGAGARFDTIMLKNDETVNYESDRRTDSSWNMHAGAVAKLTESLDFSVTGARGYRAPSLEERFQYIQLGGGMTRWGDPDLDPEESLFVETGLNWRQPGFSAGVSGFANRLDNMIAEKQLDENSVINANINKAEIHGLEAQAMARFLGWCSAYGNIAYVYGRDKSEDDYLPYIPPVNGLVGLGAGTHNGLTLKLEGVFGMRQTRVPDGYNETAGWMVFDIAAAWKLPGRVEHGFFAGIKNILDKNYRNYLTTHRGAVYNEPGRNFYAGYEITF